MTLFRMPWRNVFHKEGGSTGSVLFEIGQALDSVRFGARDDESHALAANKIVRACLDKAAITYNDYKAWRKLNPLIFTTVVDEKNQLIGFFDIFPLKSEAGEGIINGTLTERSLTVDHLVPVSDIANAMHLHLATILLNPRQSTFGPMIAKELLLLKMGEFFEKYYSPVEQRIYTAYAQTASGENLLNRNGFTMAIVAKENEQHLPLYLLRPSDAGLAMFRFGKAQEYFSQKNAIKALDPRIENIELQLRLLITKAIDGDPDQIPPHVNQKINERLGSEVNKNPVFDIRRYQRLPERLAFCDLRELQDTILSKVLWPKFESRFLNKETLGNRFNQLAGLRNAIRHSRPVDLITQKEGEIGIIWFEGLFRT